MCESYCTKYLAVLPHYTRFNSVLSLLYIDPTRTESHPCECHLCTGCTRNNFRVGLRLAYMSSTPPQTGCMTMTPCSLTACTMSFVGQTPRCAHVKLLGIPVYYLPSHSIDAKRRFLFISCKAGSAMHTCIIQSWHKLSYLPTAA